jgi:outer membrane protein OmpA-like peptidoglycan-associated protein
LGKERFLSKAKYVHDRKKRSIQAGIRSNTPKLEIIASKYYISWRCMLLHMRWFTVFLVTTVLLFSFSLVVGATPSPVISEVSPAQGFDNQQIDITVSGAKFYSPMTSLKLVKAGQPDIIATDVVVTKATITAKLNLQGQAAGVWDVVITNYGKVFKKRQKPTVLAGAFTIVSPAPTISSITPLDASNDAMLALEVTGSNFRSGATVSLVNGTDVIPAVNNELSEDEKSVAADLDLDGATPGVYDVEVKNPDGAKAVLKQSFTITEALAVLEEEEEVEEDVEEEEEEEPVDPNSLFESIYFDFDRFNIRPDQEDALQANLELINDSDDSCYIILGGHADERGPNNYNIQLSAKRAAAIKNFLISNGIDSARIITYAYGETSPKYLGHDEESWQYNRRVDIAIWDEIPAQADALKK